MKVDLNSTSKYLLAAVKEASTSTCHSRPVGCVIVKDDQIIGHGSNGALIKLDGCERIKQGVPSGEKLHLCPCYHAEVKALADLNIEQAKGATAYVTTMPCNDCMNLIALKQLKEVVCLTLYPHEHSHAIAKQGGVKVTEGNCTHAIAEYQKIISTTSRFTRGEESILLKS